MLLCCFSGTHVSVRAVAIARQLFYVLPARTGSARPPGSIASPDGTGDMTRRIWRRLFGRERNAVPEQLARVQDELLPCPFCGSRAVFAVVTPAKMMIACKWRPAT